MKKNKIKCETGRSLFICHPEFSSGSKSHIGSTMTRQDETGRTMLEMLGILALVAILSVVGLMGYNAMMSRHRANEIAQAATIAGQSLELGQEPTYLQIPGVQFETVYTEDNIPAFIDVTVEDESACEILKDMLEGRYIIEGECNE